MKGYHLSVIRHGQTRANERGIYIGHTDYPLSDVGAAELSALTDAYEYPRVGMVYSSPLRRCTETAKILFPNATLLPVEEFIEMNLGVFENRSSDELVARADFKEWLKSTDPENRPPKGESLAEVQMRTYTGLNRIIFDMMQRDITAAALVTHAGIIANLLAGFGLPKLDDNQLQCRYGEGFELLITADLWQRSGAFEILGTVPYEEIPYEE